METSDEINELATALAKAQGEIEGATKDTENPFLKSKYADLGSVWAVARKPLSDNGLSVVQTPENCDSGNISLKTILFHSSGQWLASILEMPVTKQDPQGYGSAISYARRYSFAAIIGVYSEDEDDDGESATDKDKKLEYQPAENAANNLKSIVNIILLEEACGKYQTDYKAGKTGWTKKSWNMLCSVMTEMKNSLENEKVTDLDPDNVEDVTEKTIQEQADEDQARHYEEMEDPNQQTEIKPDW